MKKADIIHRYSGVFFSFSTFNYLKDHVVPGLITWNGNEIRIPEIEFQTNPYYRIALEPDELSSFGYYSMSVLNQEYYQSLGLVPAVTAGMAQYLLSEYAPKFSQIFHPVPLPDVINIPDAENRKPIVVHAPSNKRIKGTKYIRHAVERLKGILDFEYIELSGVDWDEGQRIISACDVFIDQLILGDHGMASLEAMSYGKPVICYIKESLKCKLHVDLPIINACPDNITSQLYQILISGKKRNKLGVSSRAYIEKYHDPLKTAQVLKDIYGELLDSHK